jgi:hypothetical protein
MATQIRLWLVSKYCFFLTYAVYILNATNTVDFVLLVSPLVVLCGFG